jgi:hypothetical protein
MDFSIEDFPLEAKNRDHGSASGSCSTQGDRRALDAQAQKSVRDLRLPEASVVTIDEFIDAFLEPMRARSTVIRREQETLQVGDHNLHPGEPFIGLLGRGDLDDVRALDR